MSNAVLLGFNSAGAVARYRNRLGTDISADEPVLAGDIAAIRTTLLGTVGGLTYLGAISGASVPSIPTPSTAGGFYIISAAGTSQTKTWAIGDYAIYLGTSGQWTQIKAFRTINVKDLGAVGDGIADDTVAIQAAIDLNAAGANGTVEFPPGIYRTTAQLNVATGMLFRGCGFTGATSFSPNKWCGAMIRYEGTTGYALQVGNGTDYVYKFAIEHLRIGAAAQSPKPGGMLLQKVSEAQFYCLQINGGFATGMHQKECTLSTFDNLVLESNQIGLLIENTSGGGSAVCNVFFQPNFFSNSTAHVKFVGNARNVKFESGNFEDAPICFWVPPPALSIQTLYNISVENCTINLVAQSEARALKIDAGSDSHSLTVAGFAFRDTMLYTGGSFAIELLFNSSTGSPSCKGIEIVNCQVYAVSTAMLTCDWQNASVFIGGTTAVTDAFGGGNAKPFATGSARLICDTQLLGVRDFSAGSLNTGDLWRLPSGFMLQSLEGTFGYDAAQKKVWWYDGTASRWCAAVDVTNKLLASGFRGLQLPLYANNAAAIAGGLIAGDAYRTGGNPDLICVVH